MDEWELLVEQWKATPFEALVVDDVHRDVTRFVQTVFLLEKGTDLKKVVTPRIPNKRNPLLKNHRYLTTFY